MFRKIVVGIDVHRVGLGQVTLARRLLAPDGSITLAHVVTARGGGGLQARRSVAERLESVAAEARVDARLRTVCASSVGHGLRQLTRDLAADLLVIGTPARRDTDPRAAGDDTLGALKGVPCAVAIAGSGGRKPIREVGVGYDGSPQSDYALEVARGIAREHDASLSACETVADPRRMVGSRRSVPDEWGSARLEAVSERLADLDGVRGHAAYGRPSDKLAGYSADLDLLVVGSRGAGPAGRLGLGSTSRRLAQRVDCALLVVPRPLGDAEPGEWLGARAAGSIV